MARIDIIGGSTAIAVVDVGGITAWVRSFGLWRSSRWI